jgi:homoserine kinase
VNINDLKYSEIRAYASATVANVGCGFDIFGFAINEPGDEVFLKITDEPGVVIKEISGDKGMLPTEAVKNTAGKSLMAMLAFINAEFGIEMSLHKKMPIGSGLGSSAASSVVSVYAMNSMLKNPLSREELLPFVVEGEKIASGENVHLDNISACLYGGFILVRSQNPIDIISIPTPPSLHCTVIHPQIEIKTAEMRKMLKARTPLEKAIHQWANVAGVVTALFKEDFELLKRSLKDEIIEPDRAVLIPHFYEMRDAALENGSVGFSISGSGPSVFAFSTGQEDARKVAEAIGGVLKNKGIAYDVFVSPINKQGPRVIDN